jgi:hypothetical protein
MEQTFRVRQRLWRGDLLVPFVILILLPLIVTAIVGFENPLSRLLLAMPLGVILMTMRWLKLNRDFFTVSRQGINGRIGRMQFRQSWEEITDITLESGAGDQQFLVVVTGRRGFQLPIEQFDYAALWQAVAASAKPATIIQPERI